LSFVPQTGHLALAAGPYEPRLSAVQRVPCHPRAGRVRRLLARALEGRRGQCRPRPPPLERSFMPDATLFPLSVHERFRVVLRRAFTPGRRGARALPAGIPIPYADAALSTAAASTGLAPLTIHRAGDGSADGGDGGSAGAGRRDERDTDAPGGGGGDGHPHDDRGGRTGGDGDGGNGAGEGERKRPGKKPLIILGAVAVVLVIAGLVWWLATRNQESTDDAYTDGNAVAVAPHVAGYVTRLAVDDNTYVHRGDVLVEIDPRDYRA
jgi:membrane fusion protein (multidrug efflux system)